MQDIDLSVTGNTGNREKKKKDSRMVLVRAAVLDDAAEILKVVSESMEMYRVLSGIPEGALDAGSDTYEELRSAIASVPVFVAVDSDGHIVGSVRLLMKMISSFGIPELPEKLSLSPNDTTAYFSRFAVHEDRQGLGIGSLLYRAAEEKARSMNVSHILLHTSLQNQTMVSFYKKRGFSVLDHDSSRGYLRGLLGKKLA